VRTTKIPSEIGAKTCTICDSLSLSSNRSSQWKPQLGGIAAKNMGLHRERKRESTNKVHKKLPLLKEEKETKEINKTFF
jgi:hypothetical protein